MSRADLRPSAIELRHFRYFVAVAEELHFGRAALRLNIVQPALTAQIKSLEMLVGTELLERTKRKVELTEAGREFLRESYLALAQVGNAIDTVREFARGAIGTLRLGYGANAAIAGLIPASIRTFRTKWPSVDVTLKEMSSSEVSASLLKNEIDLGYAADTGVEMADLVFRTVGTWTWLLAVSDTHLLSRAGTVMAADVEAETLAVYAEPGGVLGLSSTMRSLPNFTPRRVHRSSHITSLMTYVSSGLGVAFVPSSISLLNFPGVVYINVDDPMPPMEMKLVWRKDGASVPVQNYLQCVTQNLPTPAF
jgi:DNA-binding transcriptional LysR family regulator